MDAELWRICPWDQGLPAPDHSSNHAALEPVPELHVLEEAEELHRIGVAGVSIAFQEQHVLLAAKALKDIEVTSFCSMEAREKLPEPEWSWALNCREKVS